ncbi:MAG TPA: hypothetical protein PKE13_17910, partial [Hyphomicrobium zavarzinii]|nr:hypothetical protein [Hyphomicrobium zavarzinii]
SGRDLWFVESSLYDFTLEEFVKILLLVGGQAEDCVRHISFEPLMKDLMALDALTKSRAGT